MKRFCHFESLEDKFNFGKYEDFSLADILDINPSYIVWCVKQCDGVHFLIDDNAISQIKTAYPEFPITTDFENLCKNRFELFENESEAEEYYESSDYNDEYSYEDRDTYERYGGSYAQDEMGYSDDDIDTIFDGDPSAYWNID